MLCQICNSRKVNRLEVGDYFWCGNCKTAWQGRKSKSKYREEYFSGQSRLAALFFAPIAYFFYKLREFYAGSNVGYWVDVGAGDGEFLKSVRAKKKLAVEYSKVARELLSKKGIEVISEQDFLGKKGMGASIISFWHVLEHIDKPWIYLTAARENLAEDGRVIIGVPNIDSFEFKIFGEAWFHFEPRYHLWHFSFNSLALMLEKEGLKVTKADYFAPEHHLTGLVQSLVNATSGTQNVLHNLVKRKVNKMSAQGLFISFFWLTLGLPMVLMWWMIASIFKKSGAFVIVAKVS